MEKDGKLVARGVADDKADVMARIHALEVLKHLGEIPVTLRFLVEGEEEIGSKTFEKIAHKHADKLNADGCLWESGGFDSADRPTIFFGVRGLLYVQLRVRLLDFDQHSGFASLYPSAAMYLIRALASLRDQDMNINIQGFYDDVVEPTEADRKMLAKIEPEVEDRKRLIGFDEMIRNPSPDKVIEQLLFTPTCNIAGVTTGYQGPGSKTVLPAEATAKLDFRLIPNQDPTDILSKLRRHLDWTRVREGRDRVVRRREAGAVGPELGHRQGHGRERPRAARRAGHLAVHAGDRSHAPGGRGPRHPDRHAGRRGPAREPDPRAQREHPGRRLPEHDPPHVPRVGDGSGRARWRSSTDKLFTVKYVEDTGHAHIEVVDQAVCATKCKGKYCNHFCPAGVYEWDEEQQKNLVSFGNCIECGACSIGCPFDNITCHSPRGGFGAQYRLG